MSNLRPRVQALPGHQNHRRNVAPYASQRESHSRCERIVSTKFLPIATCKAKWPPRNSWSENYKNIYNFKDFERKTRSNLDCRSERHCPFSNELTHGHAISIPY